MWINSAVSFLSAGERPFKCDSCSYLAANQHEVTRHARQVHDGPKPLSCPFCEYKTADRSNFKKHVELHLNPRQFLCPLCKYAASKKCNLKYHIKSRHSGCNVDLDMSKVKLRVKKLGPDGADEYSDSKRDELDNQSSGQEEDEDSSPINLSVRKGCADQTSPSGAPCRTARTPSAAPEKERPPKVNEAEAKVTTRQKKVKERPAENPNSADVQRGAAGRAGGKAKKRAKRLPAERTTVQNRTLKDRAEKESSDPRPPEEANSTEELKLTPEPKPAQKSLRRSRKSGCKKSKKSREPAEGAPQKPIGSDQHHKTKRAKEKPAKRKGAEVLDLCQKLPKTRRLKAPATEKSPSEPSIGGDADETHESGPTRASPARQNKTRTSGKTASGPLRAAGPKKHQTTSIISGSLEPRESSAESTGASPAQTDFFTDKVTPPEPEPRPPDQTSGPEPDSSSRVQQHNPTFVKPSLPPPLVLPGQPGKPAEPEDDEGIHSSHEGGSDISDAASEGSDDSGLNGAGPAKMANDPDTPTDEVPPPPPELKSHTCVFCDRMFSLEVQYRRHLNRHLVNVYFLDAAARR